jgi:hypothetical protein
LLPSSLGKLGVFPHGSLLIIKDFLMFVIQQLPLQVIASLSRTSRILYCICYNDELWRGIYLAMYSQGLRFEQSWRTTFIIRFYGQRVPFLPILCNNVFSDMLYVSFRCASLCLETLEFQNIDRRSNLSMPDFITEYLIPNKVY